MRKGPKGPKGPNLRPMDPKLSAYLEDEALSASHPVTKALPDHARLYIPLHDRSSLRPTADALRALANRLEWHAQ